MKNNAYWKERFVQLEQGQFYTAMGEYQHIQRFFNQAQKELQDEIELWYARLANNNGVSMSEARKLLKGKKLDEFKWTVEQYIQYGQDNAMNGQWLKELENASARYHISHLEALQIQTKQVIEKCYASYGLTATNAIGEAYKSALYKTAYTIQRGFGVGADVAGVDHRKLEALLAKPWAVDGKNFSERIWDNKEKLVNELHQSLSRNIMTGGDPKQVIDELAKKMNTSKANAGRLIMTESAYFSSLAEKNELADLGVEEYEIVATLDDRTSDICQGMDGQIFKVKDFQPGVNAPPFHVNCRSTTVPHFSDNFDLGERAARDKDGNTITVPANMKYPEWKKQFVKEDSAPAVNVDSVAEKKTTSVQNIIDKHKEIFNDEQIKEFKAVLSNCTQESLDFYNNYADHVQNNNYGYKGGAHYTPYGKKVNMNLTNNTWEKCMDYAKNGAWNTKFHEEFHQIDHLLGKTDLAKFVDADYIASELTQINTVSGKPLINAIEQDILNFMNKAIDKYADITGKTIKHLNNLDRISRDGREAFFYKLQMDYFTRKQKAQISMFTDMVGLTTKGRLSPFANGFWGHDDSYNSDRGKNGATSETWATFGAYYYYYDDETKKILMDIMPNTLREYTSLFEKVMAYCKNNKLVYK